MSRNTRYTITILNWDKYQREMRGGEKRRRRRDWVALSTGLLHDPDFFRLTIEQRYLWVMLLCYAGAVGPVFELSASDARVLFKLRRSADFQPFVDQGLIDLQAATGQDRTGQDKTVEKPPKKPKKKPPKKKAPEKKPASEIDGLNLDAWGKWLQYRTATNKSVYTTNGIATKLAKIPYDAQMECVTASIDQGYTGLFPARYGEKHAKDNNGADTSFAARRARLAKRAGLGEA